MKIAEASDSGRPFCVLHVAPGKLRHCKNTGFTDRFCSKTKVFDSFHTHDLCSWLSLRIGLLIIQLFACMRSCELTVIFTYWYNALYKAFVAAIVSFVLWPTVR